MVAIINVLLIIIAVLLFDLIIFIHEFGHFFTAKLSGVKVNEFALGMGPAIFKFKRGETLYSLRALPIGGYCAMEGEDQESESENSFSKQPVWKRIIIVAAGAIMNLILGLVLMLILLSQQNYFASTTVAKFSDNAVSNQYGLQVGDQIMTINGYKILTDKDLTFALVTTPDSKVDMVVKRDGNKLNLNDVQFASQTDENGKNVIKLDFFVMPIQKNFSSLLSQTFLSTVSTVKMVWASLIGLISGQFGFNDVAGPIGAASAIGQAASLGLQTNFLQAINNIVMMMAVITVNLGIVNLLPFPALDGGRLVFLIIEGIRRKPVAPKYEGLVHSIGFALLMALMVIISFSDILRLMTGKGLGS